MNLPMPLFRTVWLSVKIAGRRVRDGVGCPWADFRRLKSAPIGGPPNQVGARGDG